MQKDNLLEQLPPELIPFILKDLSFQELKNSRSINDIWTKETDLEQTKRKILFDFRTMSLGLRRKYSQGFLFEAGRV